MDGGLLAEREGPATGGGVDAGVLYEDSGGVKFIAYAEWYAFGLYSIACQGPCNMGSAFGCRTGFGPPRPGWVGPI